MERAPDQFVVSAEQAAHYVARPHFLRGEMLHAVRDGIDQDGNPTDLLTGGLGTSGLQGSKPQFKNSLQPTPGELRRNAIHASYAGLIDRTPDGGFGRFYGPTTPLKDGRNRPDDGRIAGDEYLAHANAPGGAPDDVIVLMVQVPKDFNRRYPCIVTAPSSGSRGIYGAVATVGEWGLKHGCAVVYTDKGTGIGAHDLERNVAFGIDGESANVDALGSEAHFRAKLWPNQRADFNKKNPHRFAFKHAHFERNPEQHWGEDVLRSIEFAFYVLNLHFSRTPEKLVLTPANTLVIASSVSNGGAASLRAAEQDWKGLIDAVVVAEPAVQPNDDYPFDIVQGHGDSVKKWVSGQHSIPILDYMTLLNVYQACASLVPNPDAPKLNTASARRCERLHQLGLLTEGTPTKQAEEAQRKINSYGLLEKQNALQPLHHAWYVPLGVSVTFANAYGRFNVTDNLCGYSFAATDDAGKPAPLSEEMLAALFAGANGIPPTPPGGVNIINNIGPNGPMEDRRSTANPVTGDPGDQNLDGALRLRALVTGIDEVTGKRLEGPALDQHVRVQTGIALQLHL